MPLRVLRGLGPAAQELRGNGWATSPPDGVVLDAILVLPGPVTGDGRAAPTFERALAAAAAAWRAGVAPIIVVTGATPDRPPGEAVVARRALVAAGVPDGVVRAEEKSRNLGGAVRFGAAVLKGAVGTRSPGVLLVGVAADLARAVPIARGEGLEVWPVAVRGQGGIGTAVRATVALAVERAEGGS